MDVEAARRARQKALKADLTEAYSDEEACPPEWVDVLVEVDEAAAAVRDRVDEEVRRFAAEPDVRKALARRERLAAEVRARVEVLNPKIRRLNLIVPLPRFQRRGLDAEEILRPLYRTRRRRD